jgi:Tetratricopeptide repeat
MTTRSAAIAFALVCAAVSVAHAGESKEERARAHYEAGHVQYNLGDYAAAVREFSAGYRLVQRPEFLVNLGQAYRKLGQLERAHDMYERYLAEAPPSEARVQVRQLIAEVERELAARARIPSQTGAEPEPEPEPEPASATARAPIVVAAPVEKPPERSWMRRNWWVLPVAGVVVAGLAIGIYFGVRGSGGVDCGAAELGCIDLRK